MTRVAISVDQLWRPQPGGIATYVRGLVAGLRELESFEVVGVAPRGRDGDAVTPGLRVASTGLPLRATVSLWRWLSLGVPQDSQVVHATSLAGPFAGGTRTAIHSVALHDLLWRDQPGASTARGRRFHERRLAFVVRHEELRILSTSPLLLDRLRAEGVAVDRLHPVRLGVDDRAATATTAEVAALLATAAVRGPFTLYAGTREPRKNLARLVLAHRSARSRCPDLGPLVVVGPAGWGPTEVDGAVLLGPQPWSLVKGLYRDAAVVAYVPLAEGWGLPPVEALRAGTPVVASTTTPSVDRNPEVDLASPFEIDEIAAALEAAARRGNDYLDRQRRIDSVSTLTWRQCALDHVAAWQ